MDNSVVRQPDPDSGHGKAYDKFEEEVRTDSGFGTLSISSELVPEELVNLIGAHNLTSDDIEKAFNVAALSTSNRKRDSDKSDITNQPIPDAKTSEKPQAKPTKHSKEQRIKAKTTSANRHNDNKPTSPQQTEKKPTAGPSLAQLIADAFKQDADGDTDLHLAIIHSHKQVIQIIIGFAKSSTWLEMKNKLFQTPLYLAVLTNQPDIVRLLLHCGVRAELRNSKGYTPLHIAAKFGHVECIGELVQGYESNSFSQLRDYSGFTALHIAAKNDQVKAIRALLHWGVDPNEEDDCSGYTALHMATMTGCSAVVRELLRCRSTDPNQPSFAGVLPLDMARYYYYPTIIKMLEVAGAMESDKDINRWIDDTSDTDQPMYEMLSATSADSDNYDKIILLS